MVQYTTIMTGHYDDKYTHLRMPQPLETLHQNFSGMKRSSKVNTETSLIERLVMKMLESIKGTANCRKQQFVSFYIVLGI